MHAAQLDLARDVDDASLREWKNEFGYARGEKVVCKIPQHRRDNNNEKKQIIFGTIGAGEMGKRETATHFERNEWGNGAERRAHKATGGLGFRQGVVRNFRVKSAGEGFIIARLR